MRKITMAIVLALPFVFNALAQEQAPSPSFREGDSWQFAVREWDWISSRTDALGGIYELRYSQGEIKIYEVTGEQKTEHPPTDPLLTLLGLSKDPRYQQDFRFPLSVGMKWNHRYWGGAAGSKQ
jgi:hypothetical protein